MDDHHFVVARHRFRWLIIDFDDESMIRDDSLTRSVSEFIDFDRESSISMNDHRFAVTFQHFGAIGHHFGVTDHRFRRLVIDFDDESMICGDSLPRSVSESLISIENHRFRRTITDLR
jgi:predicted Ser/Thr protein kinase